jgi:hypothetical protein
MSALPKCERNRHRIDPDTRPPRRLIPVPVELTMMETTNRNRELIADFAAQRTRLCKAKMMRVGWFAAAHDARLRGHKFAVVLVAQANSLAHRERAAGAGFCSGGR